MLQKATEIFELGHRHNQFFQIFEPAGGVG